jgi:CBS-domain-containing membrane protein
MVMKIIDDKVAGNLWRYLSQCLLATLTILAVLLFLDILNETAIIAALGASTFIVFTMPTRYSSDPRRLIGGYIVGLLSGYVSYVLSTSGELTQLMGGRQLMLIIFASLAVGMAMFIMTVTNTEHAPAAGVALGLVLNEWDYVTIIFILGAILWMVGVQKLLKPLLMDLT